MVSLDPNRSTAQATIRPAGAVSKAEDCSSISSRNCISSDLLATMLTFRSLSVVFLLQTGPCRHCLCRACPLLPPCTATASHPALESLTSPSNQPTATVAAFHCPVSPGADSVQSPIGERAWPSPCSGHAGAVHPTPETIHE